MTTHYMVTQREALTNLLKSSTYTRDQGSKLYFILEWLTDCNWHSEANEILESLSNAAENKNCSNAACILKQYNETRKSGDKIHDIHTVANTFNAIYGWGMVNNESGGWKTKGYGKEFAKEIEELLLEVIYTEMKEDEKQRLAYAID